MKNNITILLIGLFGILLLFGCIQSDPLIIKPSMNISTNFNGLEGQKTFSSCKELKESFNLRQNIEYDEEFVFFPTPFINSKSANSVTYSPSLSSGTNIAQDHSTTNVQVQGVDEADLVKTDGKYIYGITGNNLYLAEAYPAENLKILTNITLDFSPNELFISNNKLMLFGYAYDTIYLSDGEKKYSSSVSLTRIETYDVSDKSNIHLIKSLDVEGSYLTSRKINDKVYVIINQYPSYYYDDYFGINYNSIINQIDEKNNNQNELVPVYREKTYPENTDSSNSNYPNQIFEPLSDCNKIVKPSEKFNNFVIIIGLSIDDPNFFTKEVIAASSSNVYASENNIYLAQTSNSDFSGIWQKFNHLGIQEPTETNEKTEIFKFSLHEGYATFVSKGEVPGHLLNQFSMDESKVENGNSFRIATTKGEVWDTEKKSTNNIYVFDSDMKLTGKLEDLAPGEKIYSIRFMGQKAYMVTFKKVDPLFVIDLSNPHEPKVLGKLKIPGYSDYLHPIDETHIIGIGKDTQEASEFEKEQRDLDFAYYQGLKIAIFDVTDFEHPKEMYKLVVGDRGTDSAALYDHKAFLFDKDKNLLVLPITLAQISEKDKRYLKPYTYGETVFHGAYVFNLSLEKGISVRGRISHDENSYSTSNYKNAYYSDWYSQIKRSMYIGDYLYTISDKRIKANDLDDLKDVKEIELPFDNYSYYGKYE